MAFCALPLSRRGLLGEWFYICVLNQSELHQFCFFIYQRRINFLNCRVGRVLLFPESDDRHLH